MVKAKKYLGQHFLKDTAIAREIVAQLQIEGRMHRYEIVVEVGPGMGVLTQFLLEDPDLSTFVVEIDEESVVYLKNHYPDLSERILAEDFLELDLSHRFSDKRLAVIGNFPYNISSQILFRVLEFKDQVTEVVGMFQKEVAERIIAPPGNKTYGILSVFIQAYYDTRYVLTVEPEVFDPPPKVKSGVIHLSRNTVKQLDCDEEAFRKVVKQAFNQRRKTLRNALKTFPIPEEHREKSVFDRRAETLDVAEFVALTRMLTQDTTGTRPSSPDN